MARGKAFTAAQEAALRALRDDHPTEAYVEVATRAFEYGMVEGKTIPQIADKLSRIYLLDRKAAKASAPFITAIRPEGEQIEMVTRDLKTELLERIAETLERIEGILKERGHEENEAKVQHL